jgi:hypothetical protein
MLKEEEIREIYLANLCIVSRLAKDPEFIVSNYNFYVQIAMENRILKRILEVE